jgi:hypothetical protein
MDKRGFSEQHAADHMRDTDEAIPAKQRSGIKNSLKAQRAKDAPKPVSAMKLVKEEDLEKMQNKSKTNWNAHRGMSSLIEGTRQKKQDAEMKANPAPVKTFSDEEKKTMYPTEKVKLSANMKKDDEAHQPGSPQDSAHDVVEENSDLANEMKDLSPDERSAMLEHIRSLKDKRKLRSPANQEKGKD